MKVAVASQNFRTVTPHAGRTRRFLLYEVAPDGEAAEIDRLDLPKDLVLHDFPDDRPHPLDNADALIAGSCGPGFAARMRRRGVEVFVSEETDPKAAITACLGRRESARTG